MTARMWPHLGIKTGGIKRGELVVIGAFSKKDKCMYQIQVRKWNQTGWVNWLRPWLTEQSATDVISALEQVDLETGDAGKWLYQIVEV